MAITGNCILQNMSAVVHVFLDKDVMCFCEMCWPCRGTGVFTNAHIHTTQADRHMKTEGKKSGTTHNK